MAKRFISKRVVFKNPGEQAAFINRAKGITGLTWVRLSKEVNVHQRTLRDWSLEKFCMSYDAYTRISDLARLSNKDVKISDLNDHLLRISKMGGNAHFKKYASVGGDPVNRKSKWRKWWENEGSKRPQKLLGISIPTPDCRLAEFVGIMIGDGGVAPYHISVTLHSVDDFAYSNFVSDLIEDLFKVKPKRYLKKASQALDLVVQRKRLVDFCVSIGLVKGHKVKNGLDIPGWISGRTLSLACVRGIFDTDGCVFMHSYISNGRRYSYPRIEFTSASPALVGSIAKILNKYGICARIGARGNSVYIERQMDIRRFISTVGSHNEKNIRMFKKIGDVPERSKGAPC